MTKRGCIKEERESSIDSEYNNDSDDLQKHLKDWKIFFVKFFNEPRDTKQSFRRFIHQYSK